MLVDDLGFADIQAGPHASEYPTPTITKLASEGTIATRSYVTALCSPTRTSLLSGRNAAFNRLDHGVITAGRPYSLPVNQTTIGNVLQSAGYITRAYGKWDLGFDCDAATPGFRGFDSFFGYLNAAEDYYTHMRGGVAGKYPNGSAFHFNGYDFQRQQGGHRVEAAFDVGGNYSTTLLGQELVRDILSDGDKPAFYYFATQAVHAPLEAPQAFIDSPQCKNVSTMSGRNVFCAMLQAADQALAHAMTALETANALNDTVIILLGDNGGHNEVGGRNAPLRGMKSTAFEGGFRSPCVLWTRRRDVLPAGPREVGGLVHVTDWLPTLAAMAGVEAKTTQEVTGVDMLPVLAGSGEVNRSHVLLHLDNIGPFWNGVVLRTDGAKLIVGVPTWYSTPQGWDGCVTGAAPSCPTGWMPLPPHQPTPPPPHNQSLIWTFNVTQDPLEQHDLTATRWDLTLQLLQLLQHYNESTPPQINPVADYRSDPANFNGAWEPWLQQCENGENAPQRNETMQSVDLTAL